MIETISSARTELMLHLDLCPFNLPLVRFWTQAEDCWLVTFRHRVLEVGDEAGRLLGVVVHQLGQRIELMFGCYVQLQTQHQSHNYH